MLSALATNDVRSPFAGTLTLSDLVIHEFDYWTNPNDSLFGALTYTYCESDCTAGQPE